jgi:hypothetical protein
MPTEINILSDDSNFKAIVTEIRDGCRVVVWQNLKGWRRLSQQTYALPYHATRDIAHDAVQKLRAFPTKG